MSDILTSPRILLDTNVWLASYFPERKGYEESRRLILSAHSKDIELLYATESIRDVFYVYQSQIKQRLRDEGCYDESVPALANELAWGIVENMSKQATAIGAEITDIRVAFKLKPLHKDLEDNLVIAAAMRAGASWIVTYDEQLIRHSPVAAKTPAEALLLMDALSN